MPHRLPSRIRDAVTRLRGRLPVPRKDPARKPRIQGIRARLGLAMAFALLPFILLGLAQARGEYQQRSDNLKSDLQQAAYRSANNATNVLNRTDIMLTVLAPEATGSYCSSRLQILANRMPEVESLYRLDNRGRAVCSSDDRLEAWLAGISDSNWFEDVQAISADRESLLYPDNDQGFVIQVRRISRPLGDFDGVMVAVLPIQSLETPPVEEGLSADAVTLLFNEQGQSLSNTASPAFSPTIKPLADWLAKRDHSDRLLQATGPDGVRRIYSSAHLQGHGVHAVIAAPAASPWFWARSNPIRFLMMPLAAWLTAFAAVMFASERVVIRWLDYLDRIAAIYARGRYTVRPVQADNAPLEIRHLARTMDELGENITRRDTALTEALHEKDALLREIHHRVKNNLQIISSLLSMQQRAVVDPAARAALGDTRQRISALALIYRTLYQGDDVRHADSQMFLNELVGHLIASESLRGPMISSEIDADSLRIDPEKLAPMALWLVEAVSNAQKHAFTQGGGDLKVRFRVNGETSVLEVEDNGPGLEGQPPGVGLTLMSAFAKQLRGTAEVVPAKGGGTIVRLTFVTPLVEE